LILVKKTVINKKVTVMKMLGREDFGFCTVITKEEMPYLEDGDELRIVLEHSKENNDKKNIARTSKYM